jgi:peptide-methionine (R)-S-oxide reductase
MHDAASLDLFSDPFFVRKTPEKNNTKTMNTFGHSDKSCCSFDRCASSSPDDVSFSSLSRDTSKISRDKSLSSVDKSLGFTSAEKSSLDEAFEKQDTQNSAWPAYLSADEDQDEHDIRFEALKDEYDSASKTRQQYEAADEAFHDSTKSLPVDFGSDFFSLGGMQAKKKPAVGRTGSGSRRTRSVQQILSPIGVVLSPKPAPRSRPRRSAITASSPKLQARVRMRPTATNHTGALVVPSVPPTPPLQEDQLFQEDQQFLSHSSHQRRMSISSSSPHSLHQRKSIHLSPKTTRNRSLSGGSAHVRSRGPSLSSKIEVNQNLQRGFSASTSLDGGIAALEPSAHSSDHSKFHSSFATSELGESKASFMSEWVESEMESIASLPTAEDTHAESNESEAAFDFSDDDFEQADKHRFDENEDEDSSVNSAVGGGWLQDAWGKMVNSLHTPKHTNAKQDDFPVPPAPFGSDDKSQEEPPVPPAPFGSDDESQEEPPLPSSWRGETSEAFFSRLAFEADPFDDDKVTAKSMKGAMDELAKCFHEKEQDMVERMKAIIEALGQKMNSNSSQPTDNQSTGAGETGEMNLNDDKISARSSKLTESQNSFQRREHQLTEELSAKDLKIKALEEQLACASAHVRSIDVGEESYSDLPNNDGAKPGRKQKRRGSTGALSDMKGKTKRRGSAGGLADAKAKQRRNSSGGLKDKARSKKNQTKERQQSDVDDASIRVVGSDDKQVKGVEELQEKNPEPLSDAPRNDVNDDVPKEKAKRRGLTGPMEGKVKAGRTKRRGSTGAMTAKVKADRESVVEKPSNKVTELSGEYGTMELADESSKPEKNKNRGRASRSERMERTIPMDGDDETAEKRPKSRSRSRSKRSVLRSSSKKSDGAKDDVSISSKSSKKSKRSSKSTKKTGKQVVDPTKSPKKDDDDSVKSKKKVGNKSKKLGEGNEAAGTQSPKKDDSSVKSKKKAESKSKKTPDNTESVGEESVKRKKRLGGFKKWIPMEFGKSKTESKITDDQQAEEKANTSKKKKGEAVKSSNAGTEVAKTSNPRKTIASTDKESNLAADPLVHQLKSELSNKARGKDLPVKSKSKKAEKGWKTGAPAKSKSASAPSTPKRGQSFKADDCSFFQPPRPEPSGGLNGEISEKGESSRLGKMDEVVEEKTGGDPNVSLAPTPKRAQRKHSIHGVPSEELKQLALGSSVSHIVTELDGDKRDNEAAEEGTTCINSEDLPNTNGEGGQTGFVGINDESNARQALSDAHGPLTLTPKTGHRRKVLTGALMQRFADEKSNTMIDEQQQPAGTPTGSIGIHRSIATTPRKVVKSKLSALSTLLHGIPPLGQDRDEDKRKKQTAAPAAPVGRVSGTEEVTLDGNPLPHWDELNFDFKRDTSSERMTCEPKQSESFYKDHLNGMDYGILREHVIEQPYLSTYNRVFSDCGHFCCKACGNPLYCHSAKFDASNGWPCFAACIDGSIETGHIPEWGEATIEIHCYRCKSHVGNVMKEEGDNSLEGSQFVERHRVNGRALKFVQTNL